MSETATLSPTPDAPTATPSTAGVEAPVVSTGTAQSKGSEATPVEAAPSQETFLSGDPNSLPPELREKYNAMLTDYKKKTTEIADLRKKAEYYDRINKDPQKFVEYYHSLNKQQQADFQEKKAEAEVQLGSAISDEEFAKAFESKDGVLNLIAKIVETKNAKSQKKIDELEAQQSVTRAADIVESFATEAGPDGKPLRPDFYDLDQDQLITGYLTVNAPKSEKDYSDKLGEAYSWAKSMTNKYYEKGRADALAVIQKKAASSTEMPTNANKGAYTGPDPKKLDVAEAIALAKKGIRIPQNY